MGKKKSQKQIDLEAFEKWFHRQSWVGYQYFQNERYLKARRGFLAGIRYERSRVKRAKKGRG